MTHLPGSEGSLPLVSCVCPTFNRPTEGMRLLEEAVESFLRQDYPHKELLILNDCAEQELVCDEPGVRVINLDTRTTSLGEKRNQGARLAAGSLIAPWDDDDISLPWRLSQSVAALGQTSYYNPKLYWFYDNYQGQLLGDQSTGYGHNLSLYTRAAFEQVGGYPAISLGEDAEMDTRLLALVREDAVRPEPLPIEDWFYIYRWGISATHLSGRPDEDHYADIGARTIATGTFTIAPQWDRDCVDMTRSHLA